MRGIGRAAGQQSRRTLGFRWNGLQFSPSRKAPRTRYFTVQAIVRASSRRTPSRARARSGGRMLAPTSEMPTPASASPGPRRTERAASALSILVVDDDPIEVRILRKHLSDAGYSVLIARDGEE